MSPSTTLSRDTWAVMSDQNVEVVRRMYEARESGDAAGALAQFHPEVVVDATARGDAASGQGREELAAIIAEWTGTFDEWREEVEEMRDLGDSVCVVATQRGRGKKSGVEVEARYALLFEVRDDKITRMTMFRGLSEALEAAGPQ
ncbi:MAG: SnoaL-like domain [Solirubrobacterales bacterium]|nr:SnoaL-like domain [Solirubrobacterales bacterium]